MSDEAEPVSAGNPFPQTDPRRTEPEGFAAADGYAAQRWSEQPTRPGWWRWDDEENGQAAVNVIELLGELWQRWAIVIDGEKVLQEMQPCRLCIGRWAGPFESRELANAETPHIDPKLSDRRGWRDRCTAGSAGSSGRDSRAGSLQRMVRRCVHLVWGSWS